MDQLKKYHIWGGSLKMATSEVVVDYVIFFPKIGKKEEEVREPARLKTQKGGLCKN